MDIVGANEEGLKKLFEALDRMERKILEEAMLRPKAIPMVGLKRFVRDES